MANKSFTVYIHSGLFYNINSVRKSRKDLTFHALYKSYDDDFKDYTYEDVTLEEEIQTVENISYGMKAVRTENSLSIVKGRSKKYSYHVGIIDRVPVVNEDVEITMYDKRVDSKGKEFATVSFIKFKPSEVDSSFAEYGIYIMNVSEEVIIAFKK